MLRSRFMRLVRISVLVQVLVLALAVSSLHRNAFAATDWSAIQAAMGTDGFVTPGDVLRFQLVRHDLTFTVDGAPLLSGFDGAVSNGFVAFKEKHDDNFFVDGALPAQESELSALEDSLLKHGKRFRIAAVYSHVVNISPALIWIHFEGTGPGAELAADLAAALEIIHNPQLGVTIVPGTNSVFDPAEILPPQYLALFNEGFIAQMDNMFVFWLPRPDEKKIDLDTGVPAQPGLGVGQTFYIQVDFSGGSAVILNIDFAVCSNELPAVQTILRAGGFTLPSLSNNYVSDSHDLHFLHATASGNGFLLAPYLLRVVNVIAADKHCS